MMAAEIDAEEILGRGLRTMGLVLENEAAALARLSRYFNELQKWNKKVNLVARTLDGEEILENHFLDSLSLLSLLPPAYRERETVLDIGTGAGFPGLVLKAACPGLRVCLVEPRKNRYFFLRHIARLLELPDLEILNVRLEGGAETPELAGRSFSLVTSRAFTGIAPFVKLAAPCLAEGGRIVMMKGPAAAGELAAIEGREPEGGFRITAVERLRLPFSGKKRLLLTIRAFG
jgi:16S rRNA (guanine527-N7)-methyltransferase